MKKMIAMISAAIVLITGCNSPGTSVKEVKKMDNATIEKTIRELVADKGEKESFRIEKGVRQVAEFWNTNDGAPEDFTAFCQQQFVTQGEELDLLFDRLSSNFELLFGSYNKMSVHFKFPLHLSNYDLLPVDHIFGGYSPGAHFTEDMFGNKIAFVVLLNFPFYSLEEKMEMGLDWSSRQWAFARMGDIFTSRTPADKLQEYARAVTEADTYISDYNIYMGNLRDDEGNAMFPEDLKLISHWGLRDELKSQYAYTDGLERQTMIYGVMLRIINQEIPEIVINNPEVLWSPGSNKVSGKDNSEVTSGPEPNTRYGYLLRNFRALKEIDKYNPFYPTYISRKFDEDMEIPQSQVEDLFVSLVSSEELKQVGALISERLGRPLQPFDIWYNGFRSRSSLNEADLDEITRSRYPDQSAFEADLPNILLKLGFDEEKSEFISSKVKVDPSRGAGHAWGAEMKSDNARLRTRVGEKGMDYKGYNIAVHEFGHNVEQTITLHDVDYYMLHGVPNTAFTEALAFLFQKRDLELLGIDQKDEMSEHLEALDNIWSNFEIMGVSIVDMRVWKWLYENPGADEQALKQAVTRIAKEVWNAYFAPVFGVEDSPILAIYSHMIDYPLYLSAYPIGELIQFQVSGYMKDKSFADEVYRMYSQGRLAPQVWMEKAVGEPISIEPALAATREALEAMK